MKHLILLWIIISVSYATGMTYITTIKTSDGKLSNLPQWHIEMSQKLHKQQALHHRLQIPPSSPLILKTIDQEKLMLFSQALEAEKFDIFFHKLNSSLQNKLICVAGKQELASPILTLLVLQQCIAPNIIKKNIDPDFAYILDNVKQQIILDNFKNNHSTQKPFSSYVEIEQRYFASKNYQSMLEFNSYDTLPKMLQEKTNFNGFTLPMVTRLSEQSQDIWLITSQINQMYVTPTKPIDPRDPFAQTRSGAKLANHANKQYLWAFMNDHDEPLQKTITLTKPIENSLFSSDGKYLAVRSENELVLISLIAKDNALTYHETFLPEHAGKINALCFNHQSTIFAYASGDTIYFWDTHNCQLLKQLQQDPNIHLCFNHHDTRIATIAFNKKTQKYILTLWDCTNIDNLSSKAQVSFYSSEVNHNALFSPCDNKILIRERTRTTILNGMSGELIAQIESSSNNDEDIDCGPFSVLIPHTNILMTGKNNHLEFCDLYSKKNISFLLQDKTSHGKIPLYGVGTTSDGCTAVAIYRGFQMIEVELFNDKTLACLAWMNDNLNVLQKYLLLRLYHQRQSGDLQTFNTCSLEHRELNHLLNRLPSEPYNIKEFVNKYLLKKN